jgi:hypothetical protein
MRTLPKLGQEIVEQIEEAWAKPQADWARKRLLVVRLIAQHEHTVDEIMKIVGVSRQTVFTYRDTVVEKGVDVCSSASGRGHENRRLGELWARSSLSVWRRESFAKRATRSHGSRSGHERR